MPALSYTHSECEAETEIEANLNGEGERRTRRKCTCAAAAVVWLVELGEQPKCDAMVSGVSGAWWKCGQWLDWVGVDARHGLVEGRVEWE